MHPYRVVPALNVTKHAVGRLSARGEVLTMRLFDLHRVPEAFHRRVIVTIAGAAHRLPHRVRNQPGTHLVTGVLATAIRVEDQARRWFTHRVCHPQGIEYQLLRHVASHRPADDPAGEQIEHRAHVEPTLARP